MNISTEELVQDLIVGYIQQDIKMILKEIENKKVDSYHKKLLKSLVRVAEYYSKYHDFQNMKTELNIPEKYIDIE